MDELLVVLAQLIVHWRAGLSLLIGIAAAIVLVAIIPSFTGGYGLALVILAFGAGLLWEASSSSGRVK